MLNTDKLKSDIYKAFETSDYFEMYDCLTDSLELIKQYQQLKAREKSVSQLLAGIIKEINNVN